METKTIVIDEFATLSCYLVADSPELMRGKPRPAMIINPGGGYFSCSDREAEPVALFFANLGYHAFVLRYAAYNDNGLELPDLSKPLPPKDDRIFPKQVQELGKAMLEIRDHAHDWHVDTTRIGVCGFSAGGHNAAVYATSYQEGFIAGALNVPAEALRPAVAILGYPLTDYYMVQANLATNTNPMDAAFMKASNVALFGTETPDEDALTAASPTRHVRKTTPPMFLWCTAADPLLGSRQVLVLADALAKQQVPYEAHIFEEGPHGLSLATQATAEARSQINPTVGQWTTLCATWLAKRFSLPLPELSAFEKMQQQS